MPFNIRDYDSRILKFIENNKPYLIAGSAIIGCVSAIIFSGLTGYHRHQKYKESLINELRPCVESVDELPGYSPVDSIDLGRRIRMFGHEIPEDEIIELDELSSSAIVTALRTYKLFPRLEVEDSEANPSGIGIITAR